MKYRRKGFALVEMLVGSLVVILILLGAFASIVTQGHQAVQLTTETKIRLILQGEMEYLLAGTPGSLPDCMDASFTPYLGAPVTMRSVRWFRSVSRTDDKMVSIELSAVILGKNGQEKKLVRKGVAYAEN